MAEHPYVRDLIASVQKRPLLRALRDRRDEVRSAAEADILSELIRRIRGGEFDG